VSPFTIACITPRLSSGPYSRWCSLQGTQGLAPTMAPPGAGTVHHVIAVANIIYSIPRRGIMMRHIILTLWCRGMNALDPVDIVQVGLSADHGVVGASSAGHTEPIRDKVSGEGLRVDDRSAAPRDRPS
jgi:hypothetical protein